MSSQRSPLQKEIIAGLTAGTITTIVVHPLDLVKLRLQLLVTNTNSTSGYIDIVKSLLHNYNKPINSKNKFISTVQEAYRGLGINIFGNAIAWGLYFGLYRVSKDLIYQNCIKNSQHNNKNDISMIKNDQMMTPLMYLSAGVMSGTATAILTNPLWVIKTRIMSSSKDSTGSYKSTFNGLQRLLKEEGFKSLWKGLTPALFGVSQGAIYFMVYDTLKYKFSSLKDKNNKETKLKNSETILITSLSKMISLTTVYPLQLLKSNLQNFKSDYTLINLMKFISKNEGLLGFYKGLSANLIRAIPSTCITFCIYENFKHWI